MNAEEMLKDFLQWRIEKYGPKANDFRPQPSCNKCRNLGDFLCPYNPKFGSRLCDRYSEFE